MKRTHKIGSNISDNFQLFLIGLALSAMGILLWTDHTYFFWPPQFAGLMNADGLDAVAVVT